MNAKEFIKIMRRMYYDDLWGPPLPNVRVLSPARELRAAYGIVSLADSLEAAQEGLGRSLVRRFADEPEGICPPYWPPVFPPHGGEPGPGPGEPEPYDKAMLGAAMVISAEFLGNEELSKMATEIGHEMIG